MMTDTSLPTDPEALLLAYRGLSDAEIAERANDDLALLYETRAGLETRVALQIKWRLLATYAGGTRPRR